MAIPENDINVIATKIIVDTKVAVSEIQRLVGTIESSADRISVIKEIIKKTASNMGGSIKEATKEVREFAGAITGISSKEVNLAGRMALEETSGKLQSVIDKEKQLGIEQQKVAVAGSQTSRKLLAEEEKLIAARQRENILVEQAGQKLSNNLLAQQKLNDNKATAAIQKEEIAVEQAGQKLSNKLLVQENLERQKAIEAQKRENILVEQEGQKLSNNLLARQRLFDAAEQKKAQTPQQAIPAYVQKQFGDINAYIAQSQNKIEAWKRVVTSSARAAGVSFEQAGAELRKMVSGTTVAPLNTALKQLGNDGRNAFQKLIDGAHFARIALGALTSMLLFQVIQAITETFSSAIKQAREFEATLYRISNVERVLSLEGLEVSVKQLKAGIKDIKDALPIFSEEEIAQLVGSVATTTKELGYTGDEILKLSAAIGILNVNSTETESLLATQAKVTNSLISPQSKSVGSLGLSFGKAKIEAKAFEMQILKTGQSFADLTEKQKQEIKFQIVLETAGIEDIPIEELQEKIREAGGDFQALDEYLKSNDAKLLENKAAWDDLGKTLGQIILPFLPALTGFFKMIENGINGSKVLLIEFLTLLGTVGVLVQSVFSGNIKSVEDFNKTLKISMELLRTDLTNTFFKEVPEDAPKWLMRGWGDLIKEDAETATAAVDELLNPEEGDLSQLDELDDKLREIAIDAQQAQEDLDLKFSQKRSDLNVEYDRKADDAARDHAQKLEDINRDALQKIQDAKRKAREDERKAEQDLLQKLKELRQRFLMDLEDALHARDARQILRLIKEYNFEKQNILDRKKLEDKERKDKLAADLAAIEEDRKRRIEQEKIEYQRKLEDLRIAKQREIDELNLWYAREQEDIARNTEQKLQKLLDGYIQEGILHEEQLGEIEAILAKHFGTQMGMVDSLVAYAQARFAELASMSISAPAMGGYAPLTGSFVGGGGTSVLTGRVPASTGGGGTSRVPAFADGGTLFANKPTLAMFGEKQPEFVRFTPASQMGLGGRDSVDGMGVNGEIGVELMLSPDLEARVVRNAMNGTAQIVTKIRRTKS